MNKLISIYSFSQKADCKYSYVLTGVQGQDIYAEYLPVYKRGSYTGLRGLKFSPVAPYLKSKGFSLACSMRGSSGDVQFGLKNAINHSTIFYSDDRFNRLDRRLNNAVVYDFSCDFTTIDVFVFEGMALKKELVVQSYINKKIDIALEKLPLTID